MFDVDLDVSFDRLEQELVAIEALVARARVRQAELLQSLDTAQAYRVDGAMTLQEWTRGRLDVDDATARSLVTAARTLTDSDQLRELVETQVMSFDRLVATARLLSAGADAVTIRRSFGYDLAGVARLVSRRRRITRDQEEQTFRDRYVTLQPALDRTRGRVHAELPGVEYAVVEHAIVTRADTFNLPGPRVAMPQRMADALVSIAQDSLDPNPGPTNHAGDDNADGCAVSSPRRLRPLVQILVDADLAGPSTGETGAEVAYGPRVGPNALEAMLCDGAVQIIGLTNGHPVVTSNATDTIPPAIRAAVITRDGGCGADGCHSRYRLQVHHIRPKAHRGGHDIDNLVTLCWFHHHTVIHGLGFTIDPNAPKQRLRIHRRTPTRDGPDPP